ncbi:MAG: GlyGly-CTERM sorting domain-containing protein, partial [Gammaproteobacteria bacterium]
TTLTGPTGTVDTGADFSVTANVSNATASTGNMTIDANTASASGTALSIKIPGSATYKSASGTDWTCGSVSSGKLSCSFSGTLGAAMASNDLTLNFTAPASAKDLTFSATVATADQTDTDSSNDSASADVSITKPAATGGSGSSSSGGGGALGLLSLLFAGLIAVRRRSLGHR